MMRAMAKKKQRKSWTPRNRAKNEQRLAERPADAVILKVAAKRRGTTLQAVSDLVALGRIPVWRDERGLPYVSQAAAIGYQKRKAGRPRKNTAADSPALPQ